MLRWEFGADPVGVGRRPARPRAPAVPVSLNSPPVRVLTKEFGWNLDGIRSPACPAAARDAASSLPGVRTRCSSAGSLGGGGGAVKPQIWGQPRASGVFLGGEGSAVLSPSGASSVLLRSLPPRIALAAQSSLNFPSPPMTALGFGRNPDDSGVGRAPPVVTTSCRGGSVFLSTERRPPLCHV